MNRDEISKRLISLRGELTNKKLAEIANVDDTALGRWINGDAAIKLEDYAKICEAVGVPIDGIFRSGEQEIPEEINNILLAIRSELILIYNQVEGGDAVLNVILEHIRNLRGTLKHIIEKNELPIQYLDRVDVAHYVAEGKENYGNLKC